MLDEYIKHLEMQRNSRQTSIMMSHKILIRSMVLWKEIFFCRVQIVVRHIGLLKFVMADFTPRKQNRILSLSEQCNYIQTALQIL